ncbi:hypothetical protein FLJC2902T_06950 [Flavobacterium limnosediminis JC2902]|uniref:Uncharacterized protein n=1 Tax=Flavobacterium limnosediminis JC2902 TaxID=1341181 RepID=V6SS77_9FLAO|nr:hypothetical protein FLJC2902T_06950 [Flavobacterium limnosediminis JC2902]
MGAASFSGCGTTWSNQKRYSRQQENGLQIKPKPFRFKKVHSRSNQFTGFKNQLLQTPSYLIFKLPNFQIFKLPHFQIIPIFAALK